MLLYLKDLVWIGTQVHMVCVWVFFCVGCGFGFVFFNV